MAVRGLFFLHIMKTGGTTLSSFLRRRFGADVAYPPASAGLGSQLKQQPTHLLDLPLEERERIRLYEVHMPAWVAEAVAPDFHTVVVLREPVERTISHLRQISRFDWVPDDLEEIWEDPRWRARLTDYQTRFLAAGRPTAELSEEMVEALRAHLSSETNRQTLNDSLRPFHATAVATPSPLDSHDLDRAQRRLQDFDVVGVTEDLDRAGARVAELLGTEPPVLGRRNVADDRAPVPASLRRRIEDAVTLDVELYRTALALAGDPGGAPERPQR